MSWFKKLKLIKDIARGMAFLHQSFGYPHCFLHGRNVLVSENVTAKISDYGALRVDLLLKGGEPAADDCLLECGNLGAGARRARRGSTLADSAGLWDEDEEGEGTAPGGFRVTAAAVLERVAERGRPYQAMVPPEVWAQQRGAPGLPSDVYSYGILCLEILSQTTAWGQTDPTKIRARVLQGERPPLPDTTPDAEAQLVVRCCSHDPDARPTFAHINEGL